MEILFKCERSGLGNRLRALISYHALSQLIGSEFSVSWKSNWACDADFEALIDPTGWRLSTCSQAAPDNTCCQMQRSEWYDDVWVRHASHYTTWNKYREFVHKSLRALRPAASLCAMIDQFAEEFQLNRRVGIHIRRTDNIENYSIWESKWSGIGRFNPDLIATMDGFHQAISRSLSAGRIFLTTDDRTTEQEIIKRHGANIAVWPKAYMDVLPSRVNRQNGRTTRATDAMIELMLLARCQTVIGTYYSTYAAMAAMLGGCPYAEVRGSEVAFDPILPSSARLLRVSAITEIEDGSEQPAK